MNLFRYLYNKRSEFTQLRYKDLLLSKTVLDIHRKRSHSSRQWVKLQQLQPIHAIDRPQAQLQLNKRCQQLQQHKTAISKQQKLSRACLMRYLPSVSGFKVVKIGQHYIAFEGNGRRLALQQIFADSEQPLFIEVQCYHFRHSKKIHRRLKRVRK